MRDTVWSGKVLKLMFSIRVPKGLLQVLKGRGRYHEGMKLEETQERTKILK